MVVGLLALLLAFAFLFRMREAFEGSVFVAHDGESTGTRDGPGGGAVRDDAGGGSIARGADGGVAIERAHLEPVRLSAPTVLIDMAAPHGLLSGRVVGFGSARPVPNAELSFERLGVTRSTRTDAEGRFTFTPTEAGTYVLALVLAEGYLPFAPEWGHSPIRFEARPGVRIEDIVIYLVDGADYLVTVLDGAGAPVPGARVEVLGGRGESALAPLEGGGATDARGEVHVHAPDGAVVEAIHETAGRGRASVDSAAQASHRITVQLVPGGDEAMRGELSIAGRVLDGEGGPIASALVSAEHRTPRGAPDVGAHPALFAVTAEDGRFSLTGADRGAYELTATAPGFARTTADDVRAGRDDVVLTMDAEASLLVRVRDAGSAAVPAFSVVVIRSLGLEREVLGVASGYDDRGELLVGGLRAGPCLVSVNAPGHAPSADAPATLRAGQITRLDVVVDRGGRIVGRVVSSDERPLELARVTLEGAPSSGASPVPLEATTLTDGAGHFELGGIPAGRRSVVVWAADHHGRIIGGLDVASGQDVDLGTVDLSPVEDGDRPHLELVGIGAVLVAEGDAMLVERTVEGGGAAEAGLVSGDGILTVDGTAVTELGFQGTIARIRGPEGSAVALRVRRASGEVADVVVTRRRIRA